MTENTMSKKKRAGLKPRQHAVTITDPRLVDLTAAAWSYVSPTQRTIYINVQTNARHLVTLSVRVPR